jgi:hypothetical protein
MSTTNHDKIKKQFLKEGQYSIKYMLIKASNTVWKKNKFVFFLIFIIIFVGCFFYLMGSKRLSMHTGSKLGKVKVEKDYNTGEVANLFIHLLKNHTADKTRNLILIDPEAYVKTKEKIKTHKIEGSDLDYMTSADQIKESVESINSIYLPGKFFLGYNPGVIKYNDNYLISFRTDHSTETKQNTYISMVELDANFKVIGEPQLLIEGLCTEAKCFAEDPRIFRFRDDLYVVFNSSVNMREDWIYGAREMKLAKIIKNKNNKFVVEKVIRLVPPFEKQIEKNWAPLVFENELYFVYTVQPRLIIIKPNLKTGYSEVVLNEPSKINSQFGELRNTTSFEFLTDHKYLAVLHAHLPHENRWYYFNFPAMLECKNGIKSCKIDVLDSPILYDYAPSSRVLSVLYISGIVNNQKNDQLTMFAGLNDAEILSITVKQKQFLKQFKKLK